MDAERPRSSRDPRAEGSIGRPGGGPDAADVTDVAAVTEAITRPRTPPLSTSATTAVPHETLVARARDALGRAMRVPTGDPAAELARLDELVEAGRTREPGLQALLLRHALTGHLAVAAAGGATGDRASPDAERDRARRIDVLLDELLAVVAERGLSLFGIDAQALVARRALLADDEENALAAVSTALSQLEERRVVDHAPSLREHRHNLCSTYRLVAATLVSLGMHETAGTLVDRVRALADEAGERLEVAACDHERIRIHVSWGLRLERAGGAAADQLRRAADAAAGLAAGDGELLGRDHAPLRRAATILGRDPGGHHGSPTSEGRRDLARGDLAALARCGEHHPSLHDLLLVELARARALARAGDTAAAIAVLENVHEARPRGERSLLLSVSRELAALRARAAGHEEVRPTAPDTGPTRVAVGAMRGYIAELEAELWSLHQARVLSLRARVAHDRLRREHGHVAAQALSDPLTGLPNRRALDETLRRMTTVAGASAATGGGTEIAPPAVAMVDLDRFKQVNDVLSHARGDEVLRMVAGALRSSLRADDLVVRYGGDEFVVVMPATRTRAAASALVRAVRLVAGLAPGEAEGVTLSVGVVGVRPPEDVASVIARADAVMYEVKRAGGDGVRVAEHPDGPAEVVDVPEPGLEVHLDDPRPGAPAPGGVDGPSGPLLWPPVTDTLADLPGVRLARGGAFGSPPGDAGRRT